MSRPTHRRCKKCGETKLLDAVFFAPAKTCRFGLRHVCRSCFQAYHRSWKLENKDRLRDRRKELYEDSEKVKIARRIRSQWKRDPCRMRAKLLRSGMRERSKARNLPFASEVLTVRYLAAWLRASPACDCCGQVFRVTPREGVKSDASPTVDRINGEDGYTLGNVALICWRCNNLKRDARPEELERIACWMRKKRPKVWGNQTEKFAPQENPEEGS